MSSVLILSTAGSKKEAQKITKALLDQKLAACVNQVSGVQSHYLWKGRKEKASEVLLLIKTRKTLFRKVQKTIQKLHSYDVPEVIAIPITAGNPDYLAWLRKETRPH